MIKKRGRKPKMCRECGLNRLSHTNKTGLCRSCSSRKNMKLCNFIKKNRKKIKN